MVHNGKGLRCRRSGLRVRHLLRTRPSGATQRALPGGAAARQSPARPPSAPAAGSAHADVGAGDRSAAEGGAVAGAERADAATPVDAVPASAGAAGGAGRAKARGKQRSKRDYAAWAAATPESRAAASQQYMGASGSGKLAADGSGEAQTAGRGPGAQPPATGQAAAASTANGAPLCRARAALDIYPRRVNIAHASPAVRLPTEMSGVASIGHDSQAGKLAHHRLPETWPHCLHEACHLPLDEVAIHASTYTAGTPRCLSGT